MTRALERGLPRGGPTHSALFKARRAIEARPPDMPAKPLTVNFPHGLAVRIREAAGTRNVLPNVLVNALLTLLLDGSLLDAVLDGARPEDVAPGHASNTNGYTKLQNATLYLLAWHCNDFGIALISGRRLARLMQLKAPSSVHGALRSLEKSLLVERAVMPDRETEQAWTLTSAGWDVARELGAFGDCEHE